MSKYRILKIANGEINYQPQRKLFWWIPFWENIGFQTTYLYKDAKKIIQKYKDEIDNITAEII